MTDDRESNKEDLNTYIRNVQGPTVQSLIMQ